MLHRLAKIAPLVIALPLTLPFLGVGTALAADGSATANLQPAPLNGSHGAGTTMVTVHGTTIDFHVAAQGLADGPHAAHIHFGAEAMHECPTAALDANHDGRLSTTEGLPAYGPVVVALTKTGDTSPASTLAVDRYAAGTDIQYFRGGVTVSPEVAAAITKSQAVVVVHGVNYAGTSHANAKSDLNPNLPASVTDPALCGRLVAAPTGGVPAGGGGAAPGENTALIGLGGAALLAAAGIGVGAVRRARG